MLLRDRLRAQLDAMGDAPDYARLAAEVLGIRNAPPALAFAVINNIVPDFPIINKSFELCYACVDR